MGEAYDLRVGSIQIPGADFISMTIDRRAASLFERIGFGTGKLVLDNNRGDYTPARSFTLPAIAGDATAGRLDHDGDLSVLVADGKTGMAFFGVRRARSGVRERIFSNTGERFILEFTTGNKLRWKVENTSGTTIGDVEADTTIADTDWHTVFIAWDMAAGNIDIFIDEVESALTTTTALANQNIDYTRDHTSMLAHVDGTIPSDCEIAGFYMNWQETLAFTAEGNRRLFFTAYEDFIYLGEEGKDPTDNVPDFYLDFRGAIEDQSVGINRGHAGDFLVVDTLTKTDQSDVEFAPVDLRPGRAVSLSVTLDTGSAYTLFTGFLDRSFVRSGDRRNETVVDCSDVGRFLQRRAEMSFQVDTNPSSVMTELLTSVGIDVASILPGDQPITFADLDGLTGADAVERVIEATAGYAFIGADGTFVMKDRNFDLFTAPVNTVTSFWNFDTTETVQGMINRAAISGASRFEIDTVKTVAFTPGPIFVPSSEQIELTFNFIDPDTQEAEITVNSVAQFEVGSTIRLNDSVEMDGLDITSALITSLQIFAKSAAVSVLNGGDTDGYLTLSLEGKPIRLANTFLAIQQDQASVDLFNVQEVVIETQLISDPLFATAYSEAMVLYHSEPTPQVQFGLVNVDEIYTTELLDRLVLVDSGSGVRGPHTIHRMVRTVRPAAEDNRHVVQFTCWRAVDRPLFILDDPVRGKLDANNKLGF